MKLLATESSVGALFRMLGATWRGTLGQRELAGVHFQQGDAIRIEGERSNVILAGEIFEAMGGKPLIFTSPQPVPSLRLAASSPPFPTCPPPHWPFRSTSPSPPSPPRTRTTHP